MKPSRWRSPASYLAGLLARSLVSALIVWVILSLPLPANAPALLQVARVPVGIFLMLILVGKLLYDTFFYDRYKP